VLLARRPEAPSGAPRAAGCGIAVPRSAGELPQPVLQLLNPHFRVGIIGLLREGRRPNASAAAIATA